MKKILNFIVTLVLLNMFALGGILGFMLATGRLDKAKWQTMMDLVKHKGTPEGLREKVADILEPPAATAPASQPTTQMVRSLELGEAGSVASAAERIQYAQQAMEQERLRLEREAQDLLQRQKLLDAQRDDVANKLAKVEADQKHYEESLNKKEDKSKAENFARSLELYNNLKPKQVKELFMTLDPDVIRDYLLAMDSAKATKIIAEFKNAEEKVIIGKVLEKIRIDGTASASSTKAQATGTGSTDSLGGNAVRN